MRTLLIIVLAGLLGACGGGKSTKPSPWVPVSELVHQDPTTYVDGGALDTAQIESRVLLCASAGGQHSFAVPLPEDGRLVVDEVQIAPPQMLGQLLSCHSVVFVNGVESLRSNEVKIRCGRNQQCWVTER